MRVDLAGVTFPAWIDDRRSVPLIEILLTLGPWILGSKTWLIGDSEFSTGSRGSDELAGLAKSQERVSTLKLVDLVGDGVQLVDGEVACFDAEDERPFLVLASVRGDDWDVYSSDREILRAVESTFSGTPIPAT